HGADNRCDDNSGVNHSVLWASPGNGASCRGRPPGRPADSDISVARIRGCHIVVGHDRRPGAPGRRIGPPAPPALPPERHDCLVAGPVERSCRNNASCRAAGDWPKSAKTGLKINKRPQTPDRGVWCRICSHMNMSTSPWVQTLRMLLLLMLPAAPLRAE